jgi:hypothetical protein
MIKKLLLTFVTCWICLLPLSAENKKEEVYNARITYYHDTKVAQPGVKKPIQGVTVAAHPHFKFGTTVRIPALAKVFGDSTFTVQDRGPAVTRKVAARGRGYVFDIYVHSAAAIAKHAKSNPSWTKVYVTR